MCTKLRLILNAHNEGSDSAILASHMKSLETSAQRVAPSVPQPATPPPPVQRTQFIPARNFASLDCSIGNLGDFSVIHNNDESYYSDCALNGPRFLNNTLEAFLGYMEISDDSLNESELEGHLGRCSTPATLSDGSVQSPGNGTAISDNNVQSETDPQSMDTPPDDCEKNTKLAAHTNMASAEPEAISFNARNQQP